MNKHTQKLLSILLALLLTLSPLSPVFAEGEETQTEQPNQTEQLQSPEPLKELPPLQPLPEPEAPQEPDPSEVTVPEMPSEPEGSGLLPMPSLIPLQSKSNSSDTNQAPQTQTTVPSGTSQGNGNVGDTNLSTGDASSNSTISNTGNNNQSVTGGSGVGSATVNNAGNGAHSNNNASATTTNNNTTDQNNSAVVDNSMDSATVTGTNSTSFNVGNSNITTGDANTSGTIYNSVNSNLQGASVSEFNIVEDHNGDYILDFAANCILGCGGTGLNTAANTDNGAYSDNTASSDVTNNNVVDQNNDAVLVNDMTLVANSGDNTASFNTNGDSNITTGDANVAANVLNFANNNIAGNVVLGVINIFGDLIGDIIIPEGALPPCSTCGNGTVVANSDNGAYSHNNASSNTADNTEIFQNNDATIENNLVLGATTGNNSAGFNTGGSSAISTGNASIDANVLNIANMNIAGGDWYLVIVNRAGQWVGQIIGAPEGALFGATSGTEFAVGPNGEITATGGNGQALAQNTDNGAGSTNNAATNTTNNTEVNQNNNADIVNNINLNANTGGNDTSYNTGGNSNITTGDATVIANIVNFVNNNITGGRLVVSVVNVFGSWMGDFVNPGQKQREKTTQVALNPESSQGEHAKGTSKDTDSAQNALADEDESEDTIVIATTENQNEYQTPVGSYNRSTSNVDRSTRAYVQSQGDEADVSVLGESTTVNETINKAVKINLAWLVVIVPGLIVLVLTGKIVRSRLLALRRM